MDFQLPKPKNWEDFESICHELWRSIWGDINAQKNGRQGQSQHGVDIYGHPSYSKGIHAVQCKGKDDNYDTEVTIEEINAECDKAKDFIPPISDYVLATTKKKDVKLQTHCLKLTSDHKYSFPVSIWSWDDIEPEIQARPEILKHHYDSIMEITPPSNDYVIDINSTQDKLAAFLTRPNIQKIMSHDLLQLIYPLLYELSDNAFKHGKAGYCKVSFTKNTIELRDNGHGFDTKKLYDVDGRGGSSTLRFVIRELNIKIVHEYRYDEEKSENVTTFTLSDDILFAPLSETYELTLEYGMPMGREAGQRLAEGHYISIPRYKKHIVVNIVSRLNFTLSFGSAYLEELCKKLKPGQDVVAYVPPSMIDVDQLRKDLSNYPIEIKVR